MSKKFIRPDWKSLRKLSANLQRAYFYCWDKADACGVYEYDALYMKADLGVSVSINELAKLPNVQLLSGDRIFFTDYIEINFGTLKEGYNPHKPTFRALEKNKISSLNQACPILEDEEEGEDEDEGKEEEEKEGEPKLEVINPFGKNFLAWEAWKTYKREEHREKYRSPKTEVAALKNLYDLSRGDPSIAERIIEQSISNRWKGLFEIKKNGTTKNKTGFSRQGVGEALSKRLSEIQQNGG